MKPEELRELVAQPESDILEFKARLPDPRLAARLISAFANTNGGTLIVGVKEGGEITGIDDPARAQTLLERALDRISPSASIHSEIVTLDEKAILVVEVQKGQLSPYFIDGRAFQRADDRIIPITSGALYTSIRERTTNLDDVLAEVKRLSETIEHLNKELIAARSWRSKIADMVLGGIY